VFSDGAWDRIPTGSMTGALSGILRGARRGTRSYGALVGYGALTDWGMLTGIAPNFRHVAMNGGARYDSSTGVLNVHHRDLLHLMAPSSRHGSLTRPMINWVRRARRGLDIERCLRSCHGLPDLGPGHVSGLVPVLVAQINAVQRTIVHRLRRRQRPILICQRD
jgi:hypothetical protein